MKRFVRIACRELLVGCGVSQNIEQSFMVSLGMTKREVIVTMGDNPVASGFNGRAEEWHYCKTGSNGVSRYVASYFDQGRVFAMKPYSVVEAAEGGNSFVACQNFVMKDDYREAGVVREYRLKVR